MDILMRSSGFDITPDMKEIIEEKVGRLVQFAPRAVRARVNMRKVSAHPSPNQFQVRVLVEVPGNDVVAEVKGPDVLSALDVVSEKVERRLRRLKTARLSRRTDSTRT